MWKLIRIILLLGTVVIVSGMHAAVSQRSDTRRVCEMAGTGEAAISPEGIILSIQDEHVELARDVQEALLEIEKQKRLFRSASRWGIIKADKSLAYNMGIRLFSFLSGMRVCGDVLEFCRICSIVRFPMASAKERVRVIVNAGEIDSFFKSITDLGKINLQAATAYAFVAGLVQVLCVWVNSQERIDAFELTLKELPVTWEDLPVNSPKLTVFCA